MESYNTYPDTKFGMDLLEYSASAGASENGRIAPFLTTSKALQTSNARIPISARALAGVRFLRYAYAVRVGEGLAEVLLFLMLGKLETWILNQQQSLEPLTETSAPRASP